MMTARHLPLDRPLRAPWPRCCPSSAPAAGAARHRRRARRTRTSTSPPARRPCSAVADARRRSCCRYYSSVHRGAGLRLAGVHRACWRRRARTVGRVRRRPRRRRRRVHPQHHRRAEPAGRLPCPGRGARASTSSTTRTCCRGAPAHRRAAGAARRVDRDARRRSTRRCAPSAGTRCVAVTGASNVTGEMLPVARLADDRARRTAPGSSSTPRSSPRTGASTSPRRTSTTWRCPGTSSTRPYGAGALVGRRDWLDAAPPYLAGGGAVSRGAAPTHDRGLGRRRRTGTRAAPRTSSARRRWPRRAARSAPVLDGPRPGARARPARPAGRRSRAGARASRALRVWTDAPDQVGGRGRSPSPTGAGRAAWRPTSPPSTASGCATGGSAPTRCSRGSCGPSGEALRVSIGLGTTAEHVDRLVDALGTLVTRGASWTYAPVDGRWTPTPDPRELDPLGLGTGRTAPGPACGR